MDGICQALIMTLIRIKAISLHYTLQRCCNVLFLSSGLYRRYWNLTSSAIRLVDLRFNAVTTGVDFHHALKQIELIAAIMLLIIYSQQREYRALA